MKDQMIDREIVEGFLEEANGYLPEILKGIEEYVIDRDGARLDTPYRYAHTIKGAASMLGFAELSESASDLEELLLELNEGQLTLGKDIAQRLQQAAISVVNHLDQVTQVILGPEGASSYYQEQIILPGLTAASLDHSAEAITQKADAEAGNVESNIADEPVSVRADESVAAVTAASETTALNFSVSETAELTGPLFSTSSLANPSEFSPAYSGQAETDTVSGNDHESFTDDLEVVKVAAVSSDAQADSTLTTVRSLVDEPLLLPESVTHPLPASLPASLSDDLLGDEIPLPDFPGFSGGILPASSASELPAPASFNEEATGETTSSAMSAPEVTRRVSAEEVNSIFTSEVSAELAEVFAIEAEDHLRNMTQCLRSLEGASQSRETLQEIRRSAHSLKGAAAMVGFREITQLAHRMEDLLDQLYEGGRTTSLEIRQLLLTSTDLIEDLAAGKKDAPKLQLLLSEFARHLESEQSPAMRVVEALPSPSELSAPPEFQSTPVADSISAPIADESDLIPLPPMPVIAPLKDSFSSELSQDLNAGAQTDTSSGATFSAAPGALSEASGAIVTREAHLVEIASEKPSEVVLLAQAASQVIRVPIERLDELVRLASEMVITRTSFEQRMGDFARQIEELRSSSDRLRRISSRIETQYEAATLNGGSLTLPAFGGNRRPAGPSVTFNTHGFDELEFDRYTEFHLLSQQLAEAASDTATVGRELGNLLGDFDSFLNRQGRLYSEVQDKLMRLRMVPLKSLATRMHRAVRNTATQLGKQIDLVLVGDETEFDKVVLEELSDSLLHLLRNAADHGIESAEVRQRRGKSAKGLIHLSAFNEGTQVVLQMYDDGGGLDPAAIRATAVRQGLVSGAEAEALTISELNDLIFLPGFSTRRQVSEVSGRGVGMDVVKTTVQKLKGTITIESESGRGTIFTIRLPMSMAMMDALMVNAAQQHFAVPLSSITQILRIEAAMVEYVGQTPVVRVGNQILPLIWLSQLLYPDTAASKIERHQPALIARVDGRDVALLVEQIPGGREIVVKNFGNHVRRVFGVMGATLMGDGSVVLILNLSELIGAAIRESGRPATRLLVPPVSDTSSFRAVAETVKKTMPLIEEKPVSSASAKTISNFVPAAGKLLTASDPATSARAASSQVPAPAEAVAATAPQEVVSPKPEEVPSLSQPPVISLLNKAVQEPANESSQVTTASPLPVTPSKPARATGDAITILIVDDSPSVRRVSTNLVRNAGWIPAQSRDGMEALEYLNNATTLPDLILMDVEMPRMDGYQLLSTLRSSTVWRDLPVIMVTSRAGSRHRDKAMELGATDYLVKPYQEEELLTLIRRLVGKTKGVSA